MLVLGIADSITSGASLVADGRVLAAVSEERLNRQKMAMGFPQKSIDEVLRIAAVSMKDVDHVAVATNSLFWRAECKKMEDYFRKPKGLGRDLFLSSGALFSRLTGGDKLSRKVYYEMKQVLTKSRKEKIKEILKSVWSYEGSISFIDHHLAHCASAYFTSGMNDAVVVSLDGAGDNCASHVYKVEDGDFHIQHKIDSYDSIGNYYAYVTHICGFQGHKHEGKITGLAAYGKNAYVDMFRRYLQYKDGSIKNIGGCFDWSAIKKIEKEIGEEFSKEDLAASVQYILEDIACQYVDFWMKKIGKSHVALAGGVFANVKLNQRIHSLNSVDNIFIHPGMGDEGLAAGAALFQCFKMCKEHKISFDFHEVENVYWGPEYSEKEIEKSIKRFGYQCEYYENIEEKIAALLSEAKIVARFSGRMEYGPRALGNRSILYQTNDVTVNDWLNKKLRRTEFMPFAPVTLQEHAHKCYVNMQGAETPARFMTITFDCTDWMRENCPAVVHIDNTARPQIIDKYTNESYYKILHEYHKLTGVPSIVNTSFNMHEEPIVCTPSDALRAFRDGEIHYLALEKYLVMNAQQ
jgi:carbamoyltransferase